MTGQWKLRADKKERPAITATANAAPATATAATETAATALADASFATAASATASAARAVAAFQAASKVITKEHRHRAEAPTSVHVLSVRVVAPPAALHRGERQHATACRRSDRLAAAFGLGAGSAPPIGTYVADDDETPGQIAELLAVPLSELLKLNRPRYGKRFKKSARLMQGTNVLVPLKRTKPVMVRGWVSAKAAVV